ncbi:UDP-glucose 4-epimerase GalE [Geobacillus thermodenitrificans]|jgi:UDP-glucose 4-epimerase|uniref:UDP-glucose 4-epimerase n=1 Tax=Geobacillus thermodenitrificans TaxID=33940 RepID=A0ABY9QEY1_GEOTD|nr:UDP-glucose 4-epimerase GalE [Geobacillus thermodenitrificans]ARP44151.1 UDP-glucose 4-epimerase [Geobacillus thermodenitrificans]MEC5187934.1 UDP-glucose 4-epimerase [Geobacillus thermodenitrificans]MED0663167.1 UDP-glucose 4-epimerase GalE [Geobacillus thermodenitrificans]MED3716486.1 UDP-glucose 4-epimerase GalE [Geobacillus thermodenitrificans]MED4917447.1 UDP-glucose 4-epimerase GalE [Geobacillus thermodenitrificans]
MAILVTGGAGYIGSHAVVELLEGGYDVVIVDNLSNSHIEAIHRIKELTGKNFPFYQYDLLDYEAIDHLFQEHDIEAVMHFAGLKAVGESVQMPLRYYHNNITGTLNLCRVMDKHNVKKMVFSSSATVYGNPERVPIDETFPLSATNPYGRTKLMIEEILRDLSVSDPSWRIALLRYFNPIGAHKSGRIGESPSGIPNNLMPYITQVAIGKREKLYIFGNDYETHDGTGVRDYIHVVDLVKGHIKALQYLEHHTGVEAFNLGTGKGYSVLDLVRTFSEVNGVDIPYEFTDRRPGDVAISYANPEKANKILNWKAEYDLRQMCEDSWRWQTNNPNGYEE